jgi:predicted MFS family arabinose efflux permease
MGIADRNPVMTIGHLNRLAIGWLTMFTVGCDLFVVSPLLPQIAADYGISPTLAGLSVTAFAGTYMLSAPLLGHLADRIGRRRMLTCCLLAFTAANLLTAAAWNLAWLVAARLLGGAAAAGISPSIYALVGHGAPSDRRATCLAIVVSGLLMSLSLGAPAAALTGAALGRPGVFGSLAAVSLVLAWANSRVWPQDHNTGHAAAKSWHPTLAPLALRLTPTIVWSTALYSTYTYLGAGLTLSGFSAGEVARVIMFYGCGAIGGVVIGGRMADRLGAKPTCAISFAGLFICFFLLRFALNSGVLVDFTFALASLAAQLFFPAQQASLVNDFPAQRATVLAWNNSALFLGISLGSLIGGQAILLGGFGGNLTISAAIAIAGWTINWMGSPLQSRIEVIDRAV